MFHHLTEKPLSKTIFLSSDPIELCDRLKLLKEEKKTGNSFERFDEEIVAKADKLLEYNCISTKQDKVLVLECLK